MTAAANGLRTGRSQLIALAGAGVAVAAILLNIGFFLRPGVLDVLGGLAQHAFVLGLMLLLTSGSRTVSLSTLGIFWLVGVWGVFGLAYLLESQLASLLGVDIGEFVSVWLAPGVEEPLKLAPVAMFLLLAARRGHQPSMSDGLMLGFMVGAGVSFHEDAHAGEILVSGDGWGAALPWSLIFPTISPVGEYFALNHALWGALSGLSIGAAVMLRHWRWAWRIALVGPLLAFTNHSLTNHYVIGEGVPWFFETIGFVTLGGRLPMLALIGGAVAVVVAEARILRWVGQRDRMFPSLPSSRFLGMIAHATSRSRAAQLLAADHYMRLRRSLYFAAWRTRRAGGYPDVSDGDYVTLMTLAGGLGLLSDVEDPAGASPPEPALEAGAAAQAGGSSAQPEASPPDVS
ncbi:MAG: PrsW family intramembrane metalloprotease [Chloroflexota bacterium]|nr:PrsW family intramembrane metalloprotease [Chloroflexota bacterium]